MKSVGVLRGHARPAPALMRALGGRPEAATVTKALDDIVGVDALAKLLTEGIDVVTSKDGRLDTKDLAAFLMARMKENQR